MINEKKLNKGGFMKTPRIFKINNGESGFIEIIYRNRREVYKFEYSNSIKDFEEFYNNIRMSEDNGGKEVHIK